jgi:hypothetical protein
MQMIVQAIDLFPLQRQECLDILEVEPVAILPLLPSPPPPPQLCYSTACVGMVDSGENKQDVSKDIIDIIVHLMGRGFLSSMDFLLKNFQLDSIHRFDTVSPFVLLLLLSSIIGPDPPSLHEALQCDLPSLLVLLHLLPCGSCAPPKVCPPVLLSSLHPPTSSLPSARKALESQHFTAEAVSALRRFSDTMNSNDLDSAKFDDFRRVVALSGRPGGGSFYRR